MLREEGGFVRGSAGQRAGRSKAVDVGSEVRQWRITHLWSQQECSTLRLGALILAGRGVRRPCIDRGLTGP